MAKPEYKKDTVGTKITSRAFKYSCSFFEFADQKYPELRAFKSDKARGAYLEAAIIVATLIMLERLPGGDGRELLHRSVAAAFPPTVGHRNLAAIQDLAHFLLETQASDLPPNAIPSFEPLKLANDDKLNETIAVWLFRSIAKREVASETDKLIAKAMGRSAWNSAIMVTRQVAPRPN